MTPPTSTKDGGGDDGGKRVFFPRHLCCMEWELRRGTFVHLWLGGAVYVCTLDRLLGVN